MPPTNWEAALPKKDDPYVQIGFVGTGSTSFRPSINLTVEEEVDLSLKEYVKAVKEIHTADPKTKYRDLGSFRTMAGEARLIELTSPSAWGEVNMLQALIVKDKKAYILTAALLKQDVASLQKSVLASLQSLRFQEDLFSSLSDPQESASFRSFFQTLGQFAPDKDREKQQKSQWEQLQKETSTYADQQGTYWQFLVLTEGKAKIFSSPLSPNP